MEPFDFQRFSRVDTLSNYIANRGLELEACIEKLGKLQIKHIENQIKTKIDAGAAAGPRRETENQALSDLRFQESEEN